MARCNRENYAFLISERELRLWRSHIYELAREYVERALLVSNCVRRGKLYT